MMASCQALANTGAGLQVVRLGVVGIRPEEIGLVPVAESRTGVGWLKLRQAGDGEILFPVDKRTCGIDRRTGKMMREDLKAARRKWIADGNPKEQRRRKKCDFLKYRDSQGRFADFHSNRHTFITNLSLVGVSPRDAQELARHSDVRLTMSVYSHVNMQDKARAIGKLAAVGG